MPTGKTVVCGIIGDPIEHSMSPVMQNAAFEAADIDWVYVAFKVGRESLAMAVAGMRALNLRGLNVTVPHKVDIMPYLDAIDPVARRIGAVNTIVNDKGRLLGYNTDAAGFVHAIEAAGLEVGGRRVIVLGAGGGARAVAYSLADLGAVPVIVNRTPSRAKSLAEDVARDTGIGASWSELTPAAVDELALSAVLIVNTTPVGMSPRSGESPCPSAVMRRDLAVCDIVYNPLQTALMRDAEAAGARTISGLEMLVGQGARAFELFTGLDAPVDVMREAVLTELHCGA
ncbi:MAG TPA: shikimate dehydrogenase [Dehalococcoidia bacterium]|nr:shikimate dehydrogenase [Dehalococcoidia bacterium]